MATTTPNYGWSVPTSSDYVAQGAVAIETLGDSADATLFTALGGNYPGLRLIKKQTIGSGVSSVNVTGAFSSTYENYKIVVSGGIGSSSLNVQMALGGSTTGYYSGVNVITYSTAAQATAAANNGAVFFFVGHCNSNKINMNIDLLAPNLAKFTQMGGPYIGTNNTGYVSGEHQVATSYTSFTINPESGGTFTGGTIYVYGYGAS